MTSCEPCQFLSWQIRKGKVVIVVQRPLHVAGGYVPPWKALLQLEVPREIWRPPFFKVDRRGFKMAIRTFLNGPGAHAMTGGSFLKGSPHYNLQQSLRWLLAIWVAPQQLKGLELKG